MGVEKFYSEYVMKEGDIVRAIIKEIPSNIGALWIDVNSALHSILNSININDVESEEEFKILFEKALIKFFDDQIRIINPTKLVAFFVDGVPPKSKIIQQRARRFKNAEKGPMKQWKRKYSRNSLTPGTDFMFDIDKMLIKYCEEMEINKNFKVFYSGHLEPGEGEQKIMNFLRYEEPTDEDEDISKIWDDDDNHMIWGNDNDLIILAMMCGTNKIFIYKKFDEGKSIISIDNFKKLIVYETRYPYHDFCVLVSLLGNDFLPRTPAMRSKGILTRIIQIYTTLVAEDQVLVTSINPVEIDLTVLRNIFEDISELEPGFIEKNNDDMARFSYEGSNFNYNLYRASWYRRALGPRNKRSVRNPKIDVSEYVNRERLQGMVDSFYEGVQWVLQYYSGSEIDEEWYYPYHYAPLCEELYRIEHIPKPLISKKRKTVTYTALEVLFAVLPPEDSMLVPKSLRWLMGQKTCSDFERCIKSPIISFYPRTIIIDSDGHDSHDVVIIPFVDMRLIRMAILGAMLMIKDSDVKNLLYTMNALTYDRAGNYVFDLSYTKGKRVWDQSEDFSDGERKISYDIGLSDVRNLSDFRRTYGHDYQYRYKKGVYIAEDDYDDKSSSSVKARFIPKKRVQFRKKGNRYTSTIPFEVHYSTAPEVITVIEENKIKEDVRRRRVIEEPKKRVVFRVAQ